MKEQAPRQTPPQLVNLVPNPEVQNPEVPKLDKPICRPPCYSEQPKEGRKPIRRSPSCSEEIHESRTRRLTQSPRRRLAARRVQVRVGVLHHQAGLAYTTAPSLKCVGCGG